MRRFFKIAAYTILAFLLLLVLLAGLMETPWFKNRIKVSVISLLSPEIHGSLQIGAIHGNLFTGVRLDSVMIYSGSEPFVTVGHIAVRYDLLGLVNKSVSAQHLTLERVRLAFIRSRDGVWNVNRIFPPSNTPAGEPSAWSFDVADLDIRDATVSFIDSVALTDRRSGRVRVEYNDFTLRDINLKAKGYYHPEDVMLDIAGAHFHAELPVFKPVSVSGKIRANEKGITIDKLLLQTAKTDLALNARLSRANIFKPITPAMLAGDSLRVELDAKKLDLSELSSFLWDSGGIQGSAAIDLDAAGPFGNLNIQRLNIATGNSIMRMTGNLRGLQRPNEMVINALMADSKIDPKDIQTILGDTPLPVFADAGPVAVTLQYAGTTKKFSFNAKLEGEMGGLTAEGGLDFRGVPAYDATFTTDRLQTDRVIPQQVVRLLTSHGSIKGQGFTMRDLASHLDITIDTAIVQGTALSGSHLTADGTATRIQADATLQGPEMGLQINGILDRTNASHPALQGAVSATAVNLARILGDSTLQSSLTFNATLGTAGSTIDDLSGDATVTIAPSEFRGSPIDSGTVKLHLDQSNPRQKALSLQSSYANAELRGQFDLDIVYAYLTEQIPNLVHSVLTHTLGADTVVVHNTKAAATIQKHTKAQESVDFQYAVTVLDPAPVFAVLRTIPINARGSISGTVRGDAAQLSLTGMSAFDHLQIGKSGATVNIDSSTLSFDVRNIMMARTLDALSGNFSVTVGEGTVESIPIRNVSAKATFGGSRGTFGLTASYDTVYTVVAQGSAAVERAAYAVDFDSLRFVSRTLSLYNVGDVQARLDTGGVRIMHATMQHHDDFVTLEGGLSHHGRFDAKASVRRFPLEEINTFLGPAEQQAGGIGFAGMTDLDLTLSGTTDAPEGTVNATIDSATYKDSPLGMLTIALRYANQLAHIDVSSKTARTDTATRLTLVGELPVNLAFTKVEHRFPDQAQSIALHTTGFEIGVLEAFLPPLLGLSGSLSGDLTIGGTPSQPSYSGLLNVANARFTFEPNNLPYVMNGSLVPAGDSVTLKNFTLANAPEERIRGTSRVEGGISVKDFTLSHFDLKLYGDLLAMSDASRAPMPTMYGPLLVEMGPDGVSFTGTPDHPYLSGSMFIRDANLTFPPTRTSMRASSAQTLPYIIIDDTSKKAVGAAPAVPTRYVSDSTGTSIERVTIGPEPRETFVGKLRYDLTIETRGKTRIRMIFTPATNEELYADLEGKVDLINDQGTPSAFGEIAIGQESYYNFIKRFSAKGTLQFDGPWDNPIMKITATYEGYKTPTGSDTIRSTSPVKVIVHLDITGTRYEPNLTMGLQEQTDPSQEAKDRTTGDPQSDALSFLLTGKYRDELTASDQSTISNVGSTASSTFVSGLTSTVLSDVLTRFLQQEFPFIQSATITYHGSESDLRISSEVYKGYLRFGGQVLNDIGNSNVSYQVSLGEILESKSIRNLFIELSHTVEGSAYDESRRSLSTNSARIYYKISF